MKHLLEYFSEKTMQKNEEEDRRLKEGTHLSREHGWNPRVVIRVAPDRHPNAPRCVNARQDDLVVVLLLLSQQCVRDGERHANVKLGDSKVDSGSRDRGESRSER
jgi:hypothetical protein